MMATLAREKCVACRRDSPRVTDEKIAELHPVVSEWRLTESDGIKRLDRTFRVGDFAQAMAFAAQVGEAAEQEGHHPRLTVEWGRLNVAWWTHKIKGLHRNDFVMAAKTDEILSRLP
jgi:4a-hydroxytetrahydrobiopterin dehydratase